MQAIELSAGTIEYEDTGSSGPVVVLLHGFAMDGSVWRHVVRDLRTDHRCVVPTMPLGSHRRPMRAEADLSPHGIARFQAEFLEALDLREVTLVGIKMPGGAFLMAQALRVHALRRLPFTFGWMAKRPVPNEIVDAWLRPLQTQRGVRRDLTKYVQTLDKGDMLAAAERLRRFDRPALVVWAPEDRVNPPEHGRRLAELLPHGRLIEIADSYTLIPEDQPGELARAIRQFIRDTP